MLREAKITSKLSQFVSVEFKKKKLKNGMNMTASSYDGGEGLL